MTQPSASPALSEADQALRKAARETALAWLQIYNLAGRAPADGAYPKIETLSREFYSFGASVRSAATVALRSDLAAAMIQISDLAQAKGEAEGRLRASEMVGVVEGWRDRALKAETERDKAFSSAEASSRLETRQQVRAINAEARATAAEDSLREREAEIGRLKALPAVEFHQQDWIPGFAAFLPGATTPQPESRAFCVLNLGSMLSTVAHGDVPAADLPGFIAESMIHEVGHVIEQWAGVEFSEERVEALCERYRAALAPTDPLPATDEATDVSGS